jgi:hypothetical protein
MLKLVQGRKHPPLRSARPLEFQDSVYLS